MEKRSKGQRGSVVAWRVVYLLVLGNKEWEAQREEEKEHEDEEE